MYYPVLRGKQFELIALREFAQELPTPNHVCPIIEPVKSTFNGLISAIDALSSKNITFALVLNPENGEFKRVPRKSVIDNVPQLNTMHDRWIPAFIYYGDSKSIESTINQHHLINVMIIFPDSIDLNNAINLIEKKEVKYIVANLEGDRRNRRKLTELGKHLIRLDDQFHERIRNADYLQVSEEKFTEEHRYYHDDGYSGFADYTILPKLFKDSGMLPYAVAIHITYNKNEDEIYVKHFVSDSNSDNTNIHGKFYEAAIKLKKFFQTVPTTPSCNQIIELLDSNRYPGLGVLKKLSIKNHLELVEKVLEDKK